MRLEKSAPEDAEEHEEQRRVALQVRVLLLLLRFRRALLLVGRRLLVALREFRVLRRGLARVEIAGEQRFGLLAAALHLHLHLSVVSGLRRLLGDVLLRLLRGVRASGWRVRAPLSEHLTPDEIELRIVPAGRVMRIERRQVGRFKSFSIAGHD